MIIKQLKDNDLRYTLECDRCITILGYNNGFYDAFDSKEEMITNAKSQGWLFCENGCFCPKCVKEVNDR